MVMGHGVALGLEFGNRTHTCVAHDRDTAVLPVPMIFPNHSIQSRNLYTLPPDSQTTESGPTAISP